MDELIPALVPRPQRVRLTGGSCRMEGRQRSWITTRIAPELHRLGGEGYLLRTGPAGVQVEAASPAGLAHGLTTWRQLIPADAAFDESIEIPALAIEDVPRFPWRGLHLDVARHFFPVTRIYEALDWCAAHKLNRFHWHLTDDQGWRLPVPSRPRLMEIAAWRAEPDGGRHGGSYTEDEIRSVVDYAAARHVLIVPEVEMPGHARAALAAYPELSCTGRVQPVPSSWGIFDDVFCAGQESVLRFLEEVLEEVVGLFPGPYVHVGGDEVPKERWLSCPQCRARMNAEGLATAEGLQSWFLRRIGGIVSRLGRTLVGWDEILEGGAPEGSIVMSWRGFDGGIQAARAGHSVVMCPTAHCYLDSYQGPRESSPRAFPRDVPLAAAYGFEPIPPGLSGEETSRILGGQACVWTEWISDWRHCGTMVFPRLCAIAEALWTRPERRDYEDFLRRMIRHETRLRALGVRPWSAFSGLEEGA